MPKCLDNLDSTLLALHQSWAGYYRWVFLRLMMTLVAVTALVISPTIRWVAIAGVITYVLIETISRLISHRKRSRIIRVKV